MSAVLAWLRTAFLVAEEPVATEPAARPIAAAGQSVVLLARPGDALALGTALARESGGSCGLVCLWGATPAGWRVPATAAARRAAARLAARGLEATATGRCVRVVLPPGEDEARAAATRASAAFDGPTVLVLAGPRDEGWAATLVEADRVVVAGSPGSPLVRAAVATLGIRAESLEPPAGVFARALAAAGLSRRLPSPRSR